MFLHQMCHPQGACIVTLLNYISKTAALAKINKIFKALKSYVRTGQAQQQHQHTDRIYGNQTDFV